MDTSNSSGGLKWLLWLVIVPVVLFVLYTWFVLSWSYSRGERAGYVQKLSQRGWLCKTWEGELALVTMPGTVAEKFYFTVRDENIAKKINETIGHRVALDYEQHVGIPTSCFGDTQYFITSVRAVPDIGAGGSPPGPVAPTGTASPGAPPAAPPVAPSVSSPAPAPAPSEGQDR